jgi:hypothetical protein
MQSELTAIAEKAGDELQIHYVSLSSLADKFLEKNSKKHDLGTLSESVNRYSFRDPIAFDSTLNGGTGGIVEGNGRLEWAFHARDARLPVPRGIKVDGDEWFLPVIFGVNANDENEAIAYSVSHNLSALWGSDLTFLDQTRLFDEGLLKDQLVGLADLDMIPVGLDGDDLDLWLGMDGFEQQEEEDSVGDGSGDGAQKGSLQDRFIVPPFSVLDARQGYWQERKRQWLAIGIQSELGRGGGMTWGDSEEITSAGLNYYRDQKRMQHQEAL